jgi:hypothetical protein
MFMGAEFGPQGKPLFRLQHTHGLNKRQMSLMDANAVAPNLRPEWEQRREVNDVVLESAEALLERVRYSPLQFAEIPPMLTVSAVKKSADLRLLAVPVFPIETSAGIMHTLHTNPASPLVDIYGEDPLRAKANARVEVNRSGHYVFMSDQGAEAALWKELGLNGNHDISADKVRKAIEEKGKFILEARGLEGAIIDIASLEEIKIHNALFGADNPIYGITSTRVLGTEDQYVMVTPDGYRSATSADISVTPPLVIRLSQPDLAVLPPFIAKPIEPELVADASPTGEVVFDARSQDRPLTPPQRWRVKEAQRRQLAPMS